MEHRFLKQRSNLLAAVIIFAVGFLGYFDSLRSPFMIDDHGFFDERIKNVKFLVSEFAPDQNHFLGVEDAKTYLYYRPFAHIIPMINYWVFGGNVIGHHAVNLLLFCLAAFMLYFLINTLFNDWALGVLTAVFYLVHPINGVVVNYITANVFAAEVIFMTAALWFLCRGSIHRTLMKKGAINRAPTQAPSIFFFLLALLCHESAMALPLYALGLLIFGLGLSFKKAMQKTWGLWLVLVLYLVFRWDHASLQTSLLQKYSMFHMNGFEYVASIVKLALWYLQKLVYPMGIVLISIVPVVREGILWWWIVLAALAGLFIFLMRYFKEDRVIRLGAVWLLLGFLPMGLACLFQPVHGLMIEPHWFIFSSSGFFLIIARIFVGFRFIGPSSIKGAINRAPTKATVRTLILIVLIPWMSLTHIYNRLWSNEEQYCLYWLHEDPDFAAVMFYLGQAYEDDKNYSEAKSYYLQALSRHYAPWMVYVNLGNMDLQQGKIEEARKYFNLASRQVPRSPIILTNVGMMYLKQGNDQLAQGYFEKAIQADALFVPARIQLAKVYGSQGKTDEAEKTYQDVLSIAPHDEGAIVPLIKIYYDRADQQKVIALCRDIFAHSQSGQSLTNVGILFEYYRRINEALASFERSMAVEPGYEDAYYQEGLLLIKQGQYERALSVWQRGLKLAPQDKRLQQGISGLNAQIGETL